VSTIVLLTRWSSRVLKLVKNGLSLVPSPGQASIALSALLSKAPEGSASAAVSAASAVAWSTSEMRIANRIRSELANFCHSALSPP
jgi:hypothetical protein